MTRTPKRKPRTFKVWVVEYDGRRIIGDDYIRVSAEAFARWDGRADVEAATLTLTGKGKGKEGR